MKVHEQYDLRRKKNPEAPKPKTSEITIKKRPEKTPKGTVENNKTTTEGSSKSKGKSTQTIDKPRLETSSTSISAGAPEKTVSNNVHSEN